MEISQIVCTLITISGNVWYLQVKLEPSWVTPDLPANIRQCWKWMPGDKRSGLFPFVISDEEKKILTLTPGHLRGKQMSWQLWWQDYLANCCRQPETSICPGWSSAAQPEPRISYHRPSVAFERCRWHPGGNFVKLFWFINNAIRPIL